MDDHTKESMNKMRDFGIKLSGSYYFAAIAFFLSSYQT